MQSPPAQEGASILTELKSRVLSKVQTSNYAADGPARRPLFPPSRPDQLIHGTPGTPFLRPHCLSRSRVAELPFSSFTGRGWNPRWVAQAKWESPLEVNSTKGDSTPSSPGIDITFPTPVAPLAAPPPLFEAFSLPLSTLVFIPSSDEKRAFQHEEVTYEHGSPAL